MIKDVLQAVEGIATYPIVSLILFFVAFSAVLFVVWQMSPAEVELASRLPLDDEAEARERDHGQV